MRGNSKKKKTKKTKQNKNKTKQTKQTDKQTNKKLKLLCGFKVNQTPRPCQRKVLMGFFSRRSHFRLACSLQCSKNQLSGTDFQSPSLLRYVLSIKGRFLIPAETLLASTVSRGSKTRKPAVCRGFTCRIS